MEKHKKEARTMLRQRAADGPSSAEVAQLMPDLTNTDRATHGVRRHLPILGSAAAVLLVIGGAIAWRSNHDGPNAVSIAGEPVAIPTNDWHPGDGSNSAGGRATVRVTESDCVYLLFGDGTVANAIWPAGYAASRGSDGVVSVYNGDGAVVARDGARLFVGGGEASDPRAEGCMPSASMTWNITTDLPPLANAGRGR